MTTQTLEPVTTAQSLDTGERRPYVVERPKWPLVWKLFGLTALLISIVVGVSIALTIERANRVARTTVDQSISSAAKLFEDFEEQRLGRLSLPVQLLGSDPSFVAAMQEAISGSEPAAAPAAPVPGVPAAPAAHTIDLVSIADQLEQRRAAFRSDLLILLDDQGRVVARTDQPVVTATAHDDLYEQSPLVRQIVDEAIPTTTGVISLGGKLYHAAVAPVASGQSPTRVGYLINAYAIDDQFANVIAESTNAGVMFFPSSTSNTASIARSSNAPSIGMQQMSGSETIFATGRPLTPTNLTIDRSGYVMTGEPLHAGKKTMGAAIFIRSLDRELAPFRQIENTLLLGGGAALLLAFVFSWLIARRVTRPIEELAGIAQAVTAGDYSVQPAVDRSDEVGILGRSFAQMMNSLRDKAELEALYAQMADVPKETPKRAEPARHESGTVLVTDLRGASGADAAADPAAQLALIARVMRTQDQEIRRQDGEVRECDGHRLLAVFRGERGIIRAIRAARAINEEVESMATPEAPLSVGCGIATGEFISGSIDLAADPAPAVVGNAPLLALLFAWHAPNGFAFVSQESAQAAGAEVMSPSTREEVRLKWLPQPLTAASLPLVSVTTAIMRARATSYGETMRMDSLTAAGITAPQAAAAIELAPGQVFAGRYRVEQIIGRGGMGIVYRATDTQLDEIVAIKTLPGDVMHRSPEDLERFKREIRLARKITHRNVLRTYDYGEADGVYFISMEFVRGYTLSDLLEQAPSHQLAPRAAVGISRQICRGLQAAHEQGIIHRDIKPQNVLIDAKGEAKLMDFGIARMAEAPEAMTQAGLIVGTPHYMSPEQVQGKQLDSRSDVYSMGVMLYEMLVGRRPFESSSLTGILAAHITEQPKPPISFRPDIGRQLDAIVLRALAKDPQQRYADASEMLADLDSVQAASTMAA